MLASLKFGVEFEMMLSVDAARRIINDIGMTDWDVRDDGSVRNGCEVVSPHLLGDDGLNQIRKVLNALRKSSATITSVCGFHVHVDASTLNRDDIKNAVRRYSRFESDIDSWHIRGRRGSSNTYCQSMNGMVDRLNQWTQDDESHMWLGVLNRSRYWKLNIAAYFRHGTLEFRQHAGTIDAEKAVNWVVFCVNFVAASKVQAQAPVRQPVANADNPYRLGNSQSDRRLLKLVNMLSQPNGATLAEMALETGLAETSIRVMISTKVRRELGLFVKLRRWSGRYRVVNSRSISTPNTPYVPPDTVFKGIPPEVVSYLKERAYELAA